MSDDPSTGDTPTRRLPEAGSASADTPTERFEPVGSGRAESGSAGSPPGAGSSAELAQERGRSRGLLIALIAIGAALVIAIIVVLVLLFSGRGGSGPLPSGSPTPSTSPTPSASPSPTPSATPSATPSVSATPTSAPPPPASPIVSYTASTTTVNCSGGGPVPVTFNWNTTGGSVTFAIGAENAETAPYQTDLPAVGGITVDYQCGQPGGAQIYSIAALHNGSVIDREVITIRE